ncbi:MAG: BlaI/MecI/CopY family transcriptional regulator [Oscillospiraceae bacterium]|nr:BlaI/MecI/CopY family transcriptional regulator [Oscillospiraceae bacterium]
MDDKKLGAVEARFADLIWQHAPIRSGELVKLCERELTWKKPTTYTVLRRLCQRGIFRNEDGVVTALISREEFYAMQSERFVEETFRGSLPSFLAAFTRRRSLSAAEIDEIRKLIDSCEEV